MPAPLTAHATYATSTGTGATARAAVAVDRPASRIPAPTATRTASRRLAGCPAWAGRPRARSAGTASAAATKANGSNPAKTRRQLNVVAMNAAAAGPTIEGTTHAVEMIAKIRGRSFSAYPRAMLAYVE